jgi:hypothetical protein
LSCVLVKNSLKNLHFLIIKLILKVTPECRKCCFRAPNFKILGAGGLGEPSKPVIKNPGSAPAHDHHHPPEIFAPPAEKNMKIGHPWLTDIFQHLHAITCA